MLAHSAIIGAPSAAFIRPNNATAYTAGDLVADVTGAGVTPLSWTTHPQRAGVYVAGVRLRKSTASITNAQFRVHLYSALPTFTSSGDNGVFATVVATGNATWLASFDGAMLAAHANGCSVICAPTEAMIVPQALPANSTIYGLVEVLAAYSPGAQEVFVAELLLEGN